MKKFEDKKAYIKAHGECDAVKELVECLGVRVEDGIEYVYDMLTLSKDEFAHKYNIY